MKKEYFTLRQKHITREKKKFVIINWMDTLTKKIGRKFTFILKLMQIMQFRGFIINSFLFLLEKQYGIKF